MTFRSSSPSRNAAVKSRRSVTQRPKPKPTPRIESENNVKRIVPALLFLTPFLASCHLIPPEDTPALPNAVAATAHPVATEVARE